MSIRKIVRSAKQILWLVPICVGITALSNAAAGTNNPAHQSLSSVESNLPTMEAAQAVMVTVELDFGGKLPSVTDALHEIERQYHPDDGQGRTFAILEAYGQPAPGNKLHLSMHVSSEKAGLASLVFRRTGEVLWKNRIVPATHPPTSSFAGKNLLIMVDDGQGKPYLLDGSKGATSILDATVRDLHVSARDFWPDGAEREVTLFYSACGCPVKAAARRVGDKTARIKDQPVIFPDDPAVVTAIYHLMGWE